MANESVFRQFTFFYNKESGNISESEDVIERIVSFVAWMKRKLSGFKMHRDYTWGTISVSAIELATAVGGVAIHTLSICWDMYCR